MDINNPFFNQSLLDLPLQLKHCQRIHWTALRTATTGIYLDVVPEHLNLDQLKDVHNRMGYDAYLLYPDHIEKMFSGLRLAHFRTIETLYCSHLELGIKTVYSILGKMADEAKQPTLSYEAVWALCLFLEKKRQKNMARVIRTNSAWQLVILKSGAILRRKNGHTFLPKIVCIIDTEALKVLAYHIMDCDDNNLDKGVRRVIYDALVMNRKPAALAPSGLEWYVPSTFHSATGLNSATMRALKQQLQIEVQSKAVQNRLLDILQGRWDADLAGREMSFEHFDRVFDNYHNP